MYRIDIGGNLRELLFEPAEVQNYRPSISAMYICYSDSVNQRMWGGAGQAP